MENLVLVRHGESEWNAQGLWTGWTDIPLSERGIEQARNTGEQLRGLQFDTAFTSNLTRAQQTLGQILEVLGQNPQITRSEALNERNYGIYTGRNKWEIEQEVGPEKFREIRRAWDCPIPDGESLKDVSDRVIPYYGESIATQLRAGKSVLIAAHGNSLRALVKHLEGIPDDEIATLEIGTGEAYVYGIDINGTVTHKEIRGANPQTRKV